MSTIIEAIYESGVLRPLDATGLQERHHYRLVLEEIPASGPVLDSDLAAEIEKRTTISPDGRIVRLGGVLGRKPQSSQRAKTPFQMRSKSCGANG